MGLSSGATGDPGQKTPLHRIVTRHLGSWLTARSLGERPVPTHVEGEFREYLRCGILCFGFARARCTGCGHGFLVAFSCKGCGVCPSCTGRRMAQTAAHLADRVIPPVPLRQWVLSVPTPQRNANPLSLSLRERAGVRVPPMPRAATARAGPRPADPLGRDPPGA